MTKTNPAVDENGAAGAYTAPTARPEAALTSVMEGKDIKASSIWSEAKGADAPPTKGLHPQAIDFITFYAKCRNVPLDFVTPAVLAAAAAAAGNSVTVQGGGYDNKLNLWIAIVADSGSNKSTPLAEILRPLQEIDTRLRNDYAAEWERYEREKAAASKARKKGGEEQQLPAPPKRQALIIGDVTEEARTLYLKDCARGLLHYSDELAVMLGNLGRYAKNGATSELTNLMSLYDGRPSQVDRLGRQPLKVGSPYYSLIGTIQTECAAERLATKQLYSIGFTPRILIFEPSKLKYSAEMPTYSEELEANLRKWGGWIESIWRAGDRTITPSKAAEQAARAFNAEAVEIQNETNNPAAVAVIAKLRIALWKLAGIAHIINEAASGVKESVIKPEEMKWAADICRYSYRRHMRQLERGGLTTEPPSIKDAALALIKAKPDIKKAQLAEAIGITPDLLSVWVHREKKKKA